MPIKENLFGGVSFASDGYHARVNAQREQNMAQGQDHFSTPEFFSMDFSHQLPSQPGQALLTFGSSEAKANAQLKSQRHLQQTTQQQPSQQQQSDQEQASSASSALPNPPLQTMTRETTPSTSFIEVERPPTPVQQQAPTIPMSPRTVSGPQPAPVELATP